MPGKDGSGEPGSLLCPFLSCAPSICAAPEGAQQLLSVFYNGAIKEWEEEEVKAEMLDCQNY